MKRALLVLSAWVMGCGGAQTIPAASPPPAMKDEVPGWVLRTPRKEGQVCATGAVDPTFYRQDGRVTAAETARGELARTIQVEVTSVMYDEQTTSGGYVDQAIVTEVIGSISEAVIAGAEVVSYWYDETGAVSRNGMTYALACMRTDQSVAELAERLKQVFPDEEHDERIEAVKERAQAAFDELEKMEAQHDQVASPVPENSDPPDVPEEKTLVAPAE